MAKQKIVGVQKAKTGINSWRIFFYVNGKKVAQTVKADSKAEAFKIRQKTIVDIQSGSYTKKDLININELFEVFDKNYLANNVRSNTRIEYRGNFNRYISSNLGRIKVQNLKARDIIQMYSYLIDNKNLAGGTMKILHAYLRKMLNFAVSMDYIQVNPMNNKVPTPKSNKEDFVVWPIEKTMTFLEETKKEHKQYYYAFAFTLFTGLRRSELIGLQWKDVNFDEASIQLTRTVVVEAGKKYPYVSTGKTDIAMSKIHLSNIAVDLLREIQGTQLLHKSKSEGVYSNPNGWIFTNELGSLLNADYCTKVFNKILKKLDWPTKEMSLKGFRHLFATHLVSNNVNMKTVQSLLRHSTYNLTANTYSHITGDLQKEAVKEIDNIFIGAKDDTTKRS